MLAAGETIYIIRQFIYKLGQRLIRKSKVGKKQYLHQHLSRPNLLLLALLFFCKIAQLSITSYVRRRRPKLWW